MKIFGRFFLGVMLSWQCVGFANSVNLFNDSPVRLRAVVMGADGSQLGEFILNPRDATQWSDDDDLGVVSSDASQVPYTVYWYCMGGASFGVCENVSAGAVVTAQSCGGNQECPSSNGEGL